jgi:acyl carrier protein phosphodiesterase
MFYDHFLAKNWVNYSDEDLDDYVAAFYQSLVTTFHFSERTITIMPYMIKQNWLLSYQTIEG